MKKALPIALFFYLAFTFFVSSTAGAVEIDPLRLEHTLDAGKNYSGSFRLKNTSESSIIITPSTGAYRYIFSHETIAPKETAKKSLPSCQTWFQFNQSEIKLEPGVSADISFIIKVPVTAAQEHLCCVIFEERVSRDKKASKDRPGDGKVSMNIIPRFIIPVYVVIKGTEKISAEIKELTAAREPKKGGALITLSIENTGNCHLRPSGTLAFFDEKGEIVKTVPIGKFLPIFPGYQESVPVLCPGLPPGKYSCVATVEILSLIHI